MELGWIDFSKTERSKILAVFDDVPFSECCIELPAYTNKRQIKASIIIERTRLDLFDYLLDKKSIIEEENWY